MKESFVFFETWASALENLPDDLRLRVYDAIVKYGIHGIKTEFSGIEQMALSMIYNDIDAAKSKRKDKAEKNRENAMKRWNANECERMQSDTTAYNRIQSDANGCDRIRTDANDAVDGDGDVNVDGNVDVDVEEKKFCFQQNQKKEIELFENPVSVGSAKPIKRKVAQKEKHKWGNYQNVLLTDEEAERLKIDYGDDAVGIVENFSELKAMKGYKYKSDYLAIKKWGANAYFEQKTKQNGNSEIDKIVEAGFAMASAHGN